MASPNSLLPVTLEITKRFPQRSPETMVADPMCKRRRHSQKVKYLSVTSLFIRNGVVLVPPTATPIRHLNGSLQLRGPRHTGRIGHCLPLLPRDGCEAW